MRERPLRTTVVGSYPFPGWLEIARRHLDEFGAVDREELMDDAVAAAISDQMGAGLDVITDGEQTRLDYNLSFYGYVQGIQTDEAEVRRLGPPAHDQRGKYRVISDLRAPRGFGAVADFKRLHRLAPPGPVLKASLPGPYTLAGRLIPNWQYPDRHALTEGLLPWVRKELEDLVKAGCKEITVDEPSMSCRAHAEDPAKLVDFFNRTVEPIRGRCRLSTHLCFGNYKGRAVGPRRYAALFPAFLDLHVDEIHVEMASREFAELELIRSIAQTKDAAVGIVDVKSSYIETVEDVAARVRACLEYAPADRLVLAPDCGLSQTARWASRLKLRNMVAGVSQTRGRL